MAVKDKTLLLVVRRDVEIAESQSVLPVVDELSAANGALRFPNQERTDRILAEN